MRGNPVFIFLLTQLNVMVCYFNYSAANNAHSPPLIFFSSYPAGRALTPDESNICLFPVSTWAVECWWWKSHNKADGCWYNALLHLQTGPWHWLEVLRWSASYLSDSAQRLFSTHSLFRYETIAFSPSTPLLIHSRWTFLLPSRESQSHLKRNYLHQIYRFICICAWVDWKAWMIFCTSY